MVEPENVMHYMTERELMWRATKNSRNAVYNDKESGVYVIDERGKLYYVFITN